GHRTGLYAEKLAEIALVLKGYRILARRFRTPLGEIDLVARQGNTLVFTEVKWRKTTDAAAEAIYPANRRRVENAAALYLQKYPEYTDMNIRFDAVVLAPKSWPRHIQAAWECET